MAKGISLHIGLNVIDPDVYGTDGALRGCENDANAMAGIARKLGYSNVNLLLSQAATRSAVINGIKSAAQTLQSGDIFFLTYSGHGSNVTDRNGDETDRKDETWCLYDGQLVDDELYNLWAYFKAGVRIIVLSDSCHSGTVTKELEYGLVEGENRSANKLYRFLPEEFSNIEFEANKERYDAIPKPNTKALGCTIKLISGCQDNQLSSDGRVNGLFTEKLLQVWNNGAFSQNYAAFHKAIVRLLPSDQTPNLYTVGQANTTFDNQRPFVI